MMLGIGRDKPKLLQINSASIVGEPGTGYEGAKGGPFNCGNCEYFRSSDSSCGQKDMMKLSKQPKVADGRIKVEAKGCCEYVERLGNKE